MDRRRLGSEGEARAAAWYEAAGYEVLARNWRCPRGELDLVCRRGRVVAFCQVKTRSGQAFGTPAEAVTPDKHRRVRRLAVLWLAELGIGGVEVRFDVAAVTGAQVEVLTGAF